MADLFDLDSALQELNLSASDIDLFGLNDTFLDYPTNSTVDVPPTGWKVEWWILVVLLCFSGATIVGNVMVIMAVWRIRCMRTVTNYLVTSLATADLLVGALVMPIGAVMEAMNGVWIFGQDWCDVWHSLDVLCSTASILNLCAISIDRYIAITDPLAYPMKMTRKVGAVLIGIVWFLSSLISFPAIGWWRSVPGHNSGPQERCLFTQDLGYLAFSSIISFYAPLFAMVFTYCRIYRSAVNTTKSLRLGCKYICRSPNKASQHRADGQGSLYQSVHAQEDGDSVMALRIHRGGQTTLKISTRRESNKRLQQHPAMDQLHEEPPQENNKVPSEESASGTVGNGDEDSNGQPTLQQQHSEISAFSVVVPNNVRQSATTGPVSTSSTYNNNNNNKGVSFSRKLARFVKEKKAAKTLGIVMGVFIVCWFPYFLICNLIMGVCAAVKVQCIPESPMLFSVLTWLGWINSGMNPVIYVCWSREFRLAFHDLLWSCFCRRRRHYRRPLVRQETYSSGNVAHIRAHHNNDFC